MDDLVQWLRAQLDDDERVARRVEGSWRILAPETGVIIASDGDRAEQCAEAHWGGVGEHIVNHDPARVLREVETKRRIVDLHSGSHECSTFESNCTWIDDGDACSTLLLLALPYSDRPGYLDEWKP